MLIQLVSHISFSTTGNCRRFRLVTFRDNETWVADMQSLSEKRPGHLKNGQKNQTRVIQYLLADQTLSNHERQAALAANVLGESVLDGTEAVKRGLAKRGVAQTYVLLEGCPKHLGCTVVLRGSSRAALKQVKRVFRFLVNVAYNLKLETTYLRERCAKLPASFKVTPNQLYSSSLCVDYGGPPSGRKVRPWNGRNSEATQRSGSGKVTAFDHQSILVTSVWMTGTTQCCPAEVKGICYYSLQDVSLGQFLRDSCFNLSLKCQNSTCKKSVLDHSLSFIHNDGLINITVGSASICHVSVVRFVADSFIYCLILRRWSTWMILCRPPRFKDPETLPKLGPMMKRMIPATQRWTARLPPGHIALTVEKLSHHWYTLVKRLGNSALASSWNLFSTTEMR